MVWEFLETPSAAILMSVLLGMGIAVLFRPMCKDGVCTVVHGPRPDMLRNNVYPFGNKCYLYNTRATECTADALNTT